MIRRLGVTIACLLTVLLAQIGEASAPRVNSCADIDDCSSNTCNAMHVICDDIVWNACWDDEFYCDCVPCEAECLPPNTCGGGGASTMVRCTFSWGNQDLCPANR
jgi:hypothetical protein